LVVEYQIISQMHVGFHTTQGTWHQQGTRADSVENVILDFLNEVMDRTYFEWFIV